MKFHLTIASSTEVTFCSSTEPWPAKHTASSVQASPSREFTAFFTLLKPPRFCGGACLGKRKQATRLSWLVCTGFTSNSLFGLNGCRLCCFVLYRATKTADPSCSSEASLTKPAVLKVLWPEQAELLSLLPFSPAKLRAMQCCLQHSPNYSPLQSHWDTKHKSQACKLSTQPTQPSCQEAESHLASIRTLHILGGHPSWLNCRTTIHPGSAQSWPCIKLYTFTDSEKNKSLLPHCAISWKVIADHYYTLAHKQIFKTAVQILTKRKWKWMQAYANDMKPDLSSIITTSTSSLKQS